MRKLTNREFVLVCGALWLTVLYFGHGMFQELARAMPQQADHLQESRHSYLENKDRLGPVLTEMEMENRLLSMLEENHLPPLSSVISREEKGRWGFSVGGVSMKTRGTVEEITAFFDSMAAAPDLRVVYYDMKQEDGGISLEFKVRFFMFEEEPGYSPD